MNQTFLIQRKIFLTFVSLFLPLITIILWVLFYPTLYSLIPNVETANILFFVIGSIGIGIIFLNSYFNKATSTTLIYKIGNWIIIFLNISVIYFSILGSPHVKGTVKLNTNNSIIIYVDEQYREEYDTSGSQLTVDGKPSLTDSDLAIGISPRTIFYEKYGNWFWQRRRINISQIQEDQHILLKHNGWRHLTGDIVEASVIIVLNK